MRWIVLCRRFKQSSRRLGTKNNGTGTDWTAVVSVVPDALPDL
jgi:hypothetical protein